MPKTPDEIKKGLECCCNLIGVMCPYCPYAEDGGASETCREEMADDALALIQQLQAENTEQDARIHQLEEERDAAVADIKQMVQDPYIPCYCDYCKLTEEECAKSNCRGLNAFEWRGVQKEDTDDGKE